MVRHVRATGAVVPRPTIEGVFVPQFVECVIYRSYSRSGG
ncbi:hypothetical protein C452_12520 [Haloferax volcanii JCM 10717]|uniref:Uncharacterized protein n=3 Tax=Haloferax volcanii TaxID=2246 RepID=L9VE02_HALVD|nr:hypothetical protein D320_15050 [Haloferax sp. BAB-2207]ELY35276.1 hypothetical protein C498_04146 [Haloferax volcanii DS2]ELZ57105.1 hypothetical protein C460_12926 [Haloferax sp. ATCC BAA-646]ELZ68473.1 hypothetical protein C459_00130 [Haloferax sp. ATCC BAA-645]ELZ68804.1 hypothetical protein C458_08057 [Haloferax sp. ATCC BAA-644]ELZ74938.1 hypothetical protein C456_08278 [Haloferax lucentense DSM 14919]ELZ88879.1 hypothetical protein C452_12520 [Haloferax alexandrinus JCM 10717]